jgi:thymidine kinase
MFSGKSEELMRRLRRVGYARKSAILIKPAVDDRYSVDEVVSHEGQRMAARVVRKPEAILQLAACDVVGVDEGQFLDDSLIDVCEQLVAGGVRVVIAGLDLDYRREPFGPMPRAARDGGRDREAESGLPRLRRGGDVHAAPRRRPAGAVQR